MPYINLQVIGHEDSISWVKNLLTTLIGALVASSSRAGAQLRKNKNEYIFIQVEPNSEQKYHAIYQTTGKLGHGIHFRGQN